MTLDRYIRSLLQDGERPKWVRSYDPTAVELIRLRYQKRSSIRFPRESRSEYAEYLNSGHWQMFRLAVMILAGGQCCKCGKTADEIHHLRYKNERGMSVRYRERLCDVKPLCRICHEGEHRDSIITKATCTLSADICNALKGVTQ